MPTITMSVRCLLASLLLLLAVVPVRAQVTPEKRVEACLRVEVRELVRKLFADVDVTEMEAVAKAHGLSTKAFLELTVKP